MKKEEEKYNLPKFHAVYCSRPKRGGRMAFFVKKHIPMKVLNIDSSEFSFLAVGVNEIYRYHSSDINSFLNCIDMKINFLNEEKANCYTFGDMNIKLLISNCSQNKIMDVYRSNIFSLSNDYIVTREVQRSSGLIDQIANNYKSCSKLSIIQCAKSDHKRQIFEIASKLIRDENIHYQLHIQRG